MWSSEQGAPSHEDSTPVLLKEPRWNWLSVTLQWEPTFSEVRFISQLHSSYGTFTQIEAKCLFCFKSLMSYWCIIQVLSIVLLLLLLVLFDNTITNLTQHNLTCLLFGFATSVVCTRETWWHSRTHKPCLSAEIQLMSEVGKLNKHYSTPAWLIFPVVKMYMWLFRKGVLHGF